jgi:thymidylate synthase (FAD)
MTVKLQWATPDTDKQIMFMARVSNPENQHSENTRLLSYCMKEGHVSPFEMASACVEINTTRDIGRQILRHRSFSFQEFSGRYQSYDKLGEAPLRECRMQDPVNRQNSVALTGGTHDDWLEGVWRDTQREVQKNAVQAYEWALSRGIAKEQARALLPEGLTSSRLYMSGTFRSWIHYLQSRLHESTQREHQQIAQEVLEVLRTVAPVTIGAFFP